MPIYSFVRPSGKKMGQYWMVPQSIAGLLMLKLLLLQYCEYYLYLNCLVFKNAIARYLPIFFFTLDELIQIMASWGSLLNVALTLKSHHNIALYLNTCPLIKTNSLQCTDQPPSPLMVDLL